MISCLKFTFIRFLEFVWLNMIKLMNGVLVNLRSHGGYMDYDNLNIMDLPMRLTFEMHFGNYGVYGPRVKYKRGHGLIEGVSHRLCW